MTAVHRCMHERERVCDGCYKEIMSVADAKTLLCEAVRLRKALTKISVLMLASDARGTALDALKGIAS